MNTEQKKTPQRVKKTSSVKDIVTCLIIVFLVLLCGLGAIGFIVPDKKFSQTENRVLEEKPVLTVQTLFDGSFMKNTETYLTDQYPFRNVSMYLKGTFDIMLGKTTQNGVNKGKDGFLFDSQTPYNSDNMTKKAESVLSFVKKHKDMRYYFALVPNSSYVYSEKLPAGLDEADQKHQINDFYSQIGGFKTVDTVTPLIAAKQNHQLFYKTDHHWTTRGAYAVFESIIGAMGGKTPSDYFEFYPVSNSFEGTLKSKSVTAKAKDTVEICLPKNSKGSYFLEVEGVKKASFFEKEKLSEKNHYEVFLGGNYSSVAVTTKTKNNEKLLIIKDSYANCMLPMFTPYFSKIVMVDPRYMTEGMEKVLSAEKFTRVLFLYNVNTFLSDTSLVSVLESEG